MIGSLRGTLVRAADHWVMVEVGGVGFRVFVPSSTRWSLPPLNQEVFLYTHTHVREDVIALYGFGTEDELSLFEEMIQVSGVGPRLALAVLSTYSPDQFRRVVADEDIKGLTRIPGVGKKMAQRLLLELRGKLARPGAGGGVAGPEQTSPAWTDALAALVSLGYSEEEAAAALRAGAAGAVEASDAAELIRRALRELAGQRG